MKKIHLIYLYILYPILTLIFASQASLLHENLSYVGNLEGMHVYFILWAILCEIALGMGFKRCLDKMMNRKIWIICITMNACLFFFSVCLPYLPEVFPFVSNLHSDLSFLSVCLLLGLIGILCLCLKMSFSIYPYDMYLFLIYGLSFLIFSKNHMSVNSLLEVFLAISLPIYLYHLGGRL